MSKIIINLIFIPILLISCIKQNELSNKIIDEKQDKKTASNLPVNTSSILPSSVAITSPIPLNTNKPIPVPTIQPKSVANIPVKFQNNPFLQQSVQNLNSSGTNIVPVLIDTHLFINSIESGAKYERKTLILKSSFDKLDKPSLDSVKQIDPNFQIFDLTNHNIKLEDDNGDFCLNTSPAYYSGVLVNRNKENEK